MDVNIKKRTSNNNAGQARKEQEPGKDYILLPLWTADPPFPQEPKSPQDAGFKPYNDVGKKVNKVPRQENECKDQEKKDNVNSTNRVNTVSTTVNAASNEVNAVGRKSSIELPDDLNMPELEDISIFEDSNEDVFGAEADLNNLESTFQVSPIPITRNYKDHPLEQVIGDLHSAPQTRRMSKNLEEHGPVNEREIVIRNKARLVDQGHTQEEGIDYDEVFALVARIKAFRLFLAYASFKDFVVYQMNVKSAFLYGKIEEEALYGLHQAPRAWYETLSTYLLDNGFQRGKIDKTLFIRRHKGDILSVQVYVDDIIFGLTKKQLCTSFEKLMHDKFQMSSIGELTFFLGLQVKQKEDIFIGQDKYVAKILKKFGFFEVKTASTHMETQKPLLKDEDGEEVDVHIYRSMIGSLMYLTSSRPDIMFTVCAYARYQVNPKVSHLYAVKRIFRYLKDQPKLGLWYPKDSPFDLMPYNDSDYAGASLDRKSTTGGCQFLRCRLISWQCKKQTMVANSTTEAEYVAACSCRDQVLWIQNQLLDYSTNRVNVVCSTVNATSNKVNVVEADLNNLESTFQVSLILTTRIHKDLPLEQVIGDLHSAPQTRRMLKNLEEHGLVSIINQRTNHKDLQNCLFSCFLSQMEPKKVIQALKDPSWIEAMQEELLQFTLQDVWTLVDLPYGKRTIGSKWVFRNKLDERGIVIRNKARLVA
nr:putative ribonuclease H-like domain-containing protein [Tanacetum cinerariifolium]